MQTSVEMTPEQKDHMLSELRRCLITEPMTPSDFRAALDIHEDLEFVADYYDNLLRVFIKKRTDPVVAEGITMWMVKKWWLSKMNLSERIEIEKKYFAQHTEFLINLTANYPWCRNNPWDIMRNGVRLEDLQKVLEIVLIPEAAAIIMEDIKRAGNRRILYRVRMTPTNPQMSQFNITVRPYTPEEYAAEEKEKKEAQEAIKASKKYGK